MMGFTADGQLKPEMIHSRDKELGTYTFHAKKSREDLASSAPQPYAGPTHGRTALRSSCS